jgi:acetyltransferase-like isoleucine patch superfamily enzyme
MAFNFNLRRYNLACINYCHIICHTNTLGSFALNRIVIRRGATLGTESRIMGGVVVGQDAVLLEHTMAGSVRSEQGPVK